MLWLGGLWLALGGMWLFAAVARHRMLRMLEGDMFVRDGDWMVVQAVDDYAFVAVKMNDIQALTSIKYLPYSLYITRRRRRRPDRGHVSEHSPIAARRYV
jgi:hypothetical protein